jgi:Virulence factor
MTEYQITSWRELPSLVVARDGDHVAKVPLPQRFQDAIDEAAMRLGETSSEAYLDGWQRSAWVASDGGPADVADSVAHTLELQWPAQTVEHFLDGLGPSPA